MGDAIHIPLLPGFDGEEPQEALNIDDYVAWLEEYIRKEGLKNIVLVGHSNGGRIAMRYTAKHKDVKRLVLIAAAGIPNTHISLKKTVFMGLAKGGKIVLGPFKETSLYRVAEKLLYKAARESDYYKASPVMKETMVNLLKYDVTGDLKKITCPSLCIWGRRDTATPLWMGKRIAAGIPGCTMKIVDGGHNIHVTHAGEVATYIKDFL
jgi:pimeloyl-ACP methyl ester carboxylesterase